MSKQILKTAVLGLGRIAWLYHIPEIIKHNGFELAAVVDPLPDRRLEAAMEFKVADGYAATEEMYAAHKPDLVVVASPTSFHKFQILEAFEHKCDVFCDKPLALSLPDTDEIIAAMNKSGRKLMVYQPHRATSEAAVIKWILESGLLGKIYMIKHAISNFDRRADWQAFRKNGGGMLSNYGAHYIDQFLYLNRANFSKIFCELRSLVTSGDAEDMVKAVFTAENNAIFDLDINMATVQPLQPWFIGGNCGTAVFNQEEMSWQLKYFIPEELPEIKPQNGMAAAGRVYGTCEVIPWKTQILRQSDFSALDFYAKCYEYYAEDCPPFVPIAETREVMRVIEQCRNC
jgi:predicted dehydrogenase